MLSGAPTTKPQLISALRMLGMRQPATREELSALEADCIELSQVISRMAWASCMPESIWHYLSDADVRFKDPTYADAQQAQFAAALIRWEHEAAI
jgi:hypothetical protein